MTEGYSIKLESDQAADGGFLKQFEFEIKIICPLCGKNINGYVRCADNIIHQVQFHTCNCSRLKEMCQLLSPLFDWHAFSALIEGDGDTTFLTTA